MKTEPIQYGWLWVGYALCLIVGIPWYRTTGEIDPTLFGFPHWALTGVVAAVGIAALTLVAVLHCWREDE